MGTETTGLDTLEKTLLTQRRRPASSMLSLTTAVPPCWELSVTWLLKFLPDRLCTSNMLLDTSLLSEMDRVSSKLFRQPRLFWHKCFPTKLMQCARLGSGMLWSS